MNFITMLLGSVLSAAPAPVTESLHYGLFGNVHLAAPRTPLQRTVLFVSDHNGWDARAESLAQALSADGAFVIGVSLPDYLKHLEALQDKCAYPAASFEELSDWAQRHQGLTSFTYPTLLGDGAGASFAYTVAAQAPAGTFADLVTLGYDSTFRFSKPLCPGDAGRITVADNKRHRIIPVKQLPNPWLPLPFASGATVNGVLGRIGEICHQLNWLWPWTAFASRDPGQVLSQQLSGWQQRRSNASNLPDDVADLPLVVQEHQGEFAQRIAIILTGDGGWAGLDIAIANQLSKRGIDVVGLNTLKFFWHTRTPEEAVDALTRIVSHYGKEHPDADFILIGYSFGAALAPVIANRAPEQVQRRIHAQVLISPDPEAVFEVKMGDWFGGAQHEGAIPIKPELDTTRIPVLCVHGNEEHESSVCSSVEKDLIHIVELPGGHHYNGDYDRLAEAILKNIPVKSAVNSK